MPVRICKTCKLEFNTPGGTWQCSKCDYAARRLHEGKPAPGQLSAAEKYERRFQGRFGVVPDEERRVCRECGSLYGLKKTKDFRGLCRPCYDKQWRLKRGLPLRGEPGWSKDTGYSQPGEGERRCVACLSIFPEVEFLVEAPVLVHRTRCKKCDDLSILDITKPSKLRLQAVQPEGCEICGSREKGNLTIDHCHETGEIRGFLCRSDNMALGVLHSPELLGKAIEYLQKTLRDRA